MKKMLFVLSCMNVGGTEKAFLNILSGLAPNENDVTLLLLEKKGGFLDIVPNWVKIVSLDSFPSRIRMEIMDPPLIVCKSYFRKGMLLSAAGLFFTHMHYKITNNRASYYRFVLRGEKTINGYDEFHAFSGPTDIVSSFVAYKCRGGQKIQWIHFEVDKFDMNYDTARSLYKRMDEIRAVSWDALKKLVSVFPEVKGKAIACPNKVSREMCRQAAEVGYGYTDDYQGIRIVTLARMTEQKGLDIIPSIVSILLQKGLNFRWYIIGDGTSRDKIESLIEQNGVEDSVVLLGEKTNPYPFLRDSDLYVQTSIYEGYCLALSEARAFGLPVVSTEFAGAHEQLDGQDNCYVLPRSVEALAEVIEYEIDRLTGNKAVTGNE